MKKTLAASITLVAFVVPATANAQAPTSQHVKQYLHTYHMVRHQFGPSAAGCNLIEKKGSCHTKATDSMVMKSLGVLNRALAPPPTPVSTATSSSVTSSPAASYPAVSTHTVASGSYEACIISAESGGDPLAANGRYHGIGQWSDTQWLADGGGRYASSPTGASYSEQEKILSSEGTAGMHQQQGQYDRCG